MLEDSERKAKKRQAMCFYLSETHVETLTTLAKSRGMRSASELIRAVADGKLILIDEATLRLLRAHP